MKYKAEITMFLTANIGILVDEMPNKLGPGFNQFQKVNYDRFKGKKKPVSKGYLSSKIENEISSNPNLVYKENINSKFDANTK